MQIDVETRGGDARRRHAASILTIAPLVAFGCGAEHSEEDALPQQPADISPCANELTLPDGRCLVAGLPVDMLCPPAELPLEGGGCQPAGVPPDACAAGFTADGRGGCDAILPKVPCGPGTMAVPGDAACREIAPCGEGPYGSIPIDGNTEFVDQAYTGGVRDGTRERPWRTIQQGVDAAASGAIVAVAAGRYTEDITIRGNPVRLWGRCPAMVELVGSLDASATIEVLLPRASNTELHQIAVTGPQLGVHILGAAPVVIDRVWLHDTGLPGVAIEDGYGPVGMIVRGSLVERTRESGLFVGGAEALIESSVVRGTLPDSAGDAGEGIIFQFNPTTGKRATATLRGSLIEQNMTAGVLVFGSDATIAASVVRRTTPVANGDRGYGISIESRPATGAASTATVRSTIVESNQHAGILATGSEVLIDSSIIRDTLFGIGGDSGAISAQSDSTGLRAKVTVRASLLERNFTTGASTLGSDLTVEATIVRDTRLDPSSVAGYGVLARPDTQGTGRATVAIRASLVEQNQGAGAVMFGSDLMVESSVVRGTLPLPLGTLGYGIALQEFVETGEPSRATIFDSILESNSGSGMYVQIADATIRSSLVRDTRQGFHYGDGITVTNSEQTAGAANVTVEGTALLSNARAGVLFDRCSGTLSSSLSMNNRFGVVLQKAPDLLIGDDNIILESIERDRLLDASLPLPSSAPAVP